jgi:pSer/pThr/pTyr-binding forkhead associated (FHA) protein
MRATLEGAAGIFTVLPSSDLRFGRDGSRATAVLSSPQVSGLHATFRIEDGKLLVRDEASSAGTRIGSSLIEPGTWQTVADGAEVSLGPEVLRVTLKQ